MIDPSARIHPTADIEAQVTIGPRTAVWHRAQLRVGASVGADCVIGRDAFIDAGVLLGDRVKVQNAALIYHGATIGSGVFIGPNAILTNDRFPRSETEGGRLAGVGDWQVSPIKVADGASIGGGAVIVAGVEVGRSAMIGAGAVVTRDVADHSIVAGNPARPVGWACACGRTLVDPSGVRASAAFVGVAGCPRCGRQYRVAAGRGEPLTVEAAR